MDSRLVVEDGGELNTEDGKKIPVRLVEESKGGRAKCVLFLRLAQSLTFRNFNLLFPLRVTCRPSTFR